MTDSMKFGPGWLRNMSADSTAPNLSGGSGGLTSTTSSSTSNSSNGGNSQHSTFDGFISVVPSTARNTFPEFRYGREEMLSLFDKSCNIPEILPAFKKIFVEKVQYPLALTPSTDEELLPQVPTVPTQRPSWMQRSPVGFSSSTRGTGRGGSVDRGRIRGKSTYHQSYHRPTAIFGDDDLRSVASMKAERGWPERNGSGDMLSGSLGSGTLGLSSDWNGTPTSSPRKEFSSHPRNMENWRRSRNEDGSGDASTSGLGSSDGWRGGSGSSNNSSCFNSTHRWGRSTSWREEEISTACMSESSYGGASGNGISMQRSYSTITTVNERGGGYINSNSSITLKTTQNSSSFIGNSGQSTGRILNTLNASSGRNSQWSNASGVNNSNGCEIEENLPEWATENPSDGGGTFDASGAFHGSIYDEDVNLMQGNGKEQLNRRKSVSSSESSIRDNDIKKHEDNSENTTTRASTSTDSENKNNVSDSSERSTTGTPTHNNPNVQKEQQQQTLPATIPLNIITDEVKKPAMDEEISIGDLGKSKKIPSHQLQHLVENNINRIGSDTEITSEKQNHVVTPAVSANYLYSGNSLSEKFISKPSVDNSSGGHHDLSDRMQEVADDMIEKLIMDDDTLSIGDSSTGNDIKTIVSVASLNPVNIAPDAVQGNNLRGPNNFVPNVTSLLKQTVAHRVVQNPVSVSPTLPPALKDGSTHKDLQLYAGAVVNHAAIQHHHLQQQQQLTANIAAASHLSHSMNSTSAAPTELWYYRDPQSKVQGPFTAIEMTEWYRAGYFNENLYVRRLCDTHFHSLGELIKLCNDNMPFTHSHLIPMNLDNLHLPNAGARQPLQKPHYNLKPQNPPNEQCEELKGDDFLSGSVKNLMHPMSQMYFQMLHHREILLLSELSKTECFQRLTPSEKEAVVRQKLQIHALPDFVNNVEDLSNSLSSMNPTTGNQICDVMAECVKKEHLFSNVTNPSGANNAQPPSHANTNPFIEASDFILNSQQHPLHTQFSGGPFSSVLPSGGDGTASNKIGRIGDDSADNDVLNSLNLHMFLPSESANSPQIPHLKPQDYISTTNSTEYLGEQPLLRATAPTALLQNNNVVHPWLPQIGNSGRVTLHQPPLMNLQQASQQQNATSASNHQWSSGLFLGIPMAVMPTAQLGSGGGSGSSSNANISSGVIAPLQQQQQKSMPTSMWDLPTITRAQEGQEQRQQLQQHQLSIVELVDGQNTTALERPTHLSQKQHKQDDANTPVTDPQQLIPTLNEQQQRQQHKLETSSNVKSRKDDSAEKYQNGNKRANKQPQPVVTINKFGKDENTISRKNEEERRREQTEDKRRQKEEKKRQQFEEEKRRQQQAEEEKRRQILEEKERQQQIQAQRRKAMLASGVSTNTVNNCNQNKEQQRVQSSIAPWSTQTTAASKSGPCFAEIQKAERRERRADQQRQLELLEKQMRANAVAAAEANDSILKWNPSPVPVKSFAEIQAEEAKRLANEQLGTQRRKEQDMQQPALATALQGVPNAVPSNAKSISAIWTGTKVWGANISAGFWEEPTKFNANNACSGITVAAVVGTNFPNNSNSSSNNINKQQGEQQKLHPYTSGTIAGNANPSQNGVVALSRNLRKSQTVSVMQNTNTHNGKNLKSNNQQQQLTSGKTSGANNKVQQQYKSNSSGNSEGNDKKTYIKTPNNSTNTYNSNVVGNKCDSYENEFTAWCTKSLNNMNTKVDVPTFATFLQDLESPYEVKDYVRMYLGESKEYTEFAKQFLERRSRYKNLQRAQNAHNDDMCKPAPAITPSGNDNSDNRGKQKKIKKNKMTKLDARILGFSVTAAEGRTNVGDRAYIDAP